MSAAADAAGRLVVQQLVADHLRDMGRKPLGFRAFAESPLFCGLTLSPLVAAIMEASEDHRSAVAAILARAHMGGLPEASGKTRTVAVRAGGRGGKTSRLLAPKALHAAWTVPLPTLQHGEVASSLIVAPDLKLARQALSFVAGYVERSPVLRAALEKEPTQDALLLRRPDGKLVRVEILAATRGGRAVRARTLVFAGMDEAAFFYAADTGIINDQDIYSAVFQRVVPGGQVWVVSTPWLKGVGLLESIVEREWGKHVDALVVSAGTRALNPTWDPDGSIERTMRAQDPDGARREIDGEPLSGGKGSFFGAELDASVDASLALPLRPLPRDQVCAGADMGFRSDASAGCATIRRGARILVAGLIERRPEGAPLKPSVVLGEFATFFKSFGGCSYVVADGHYREAVTEVLEEHDLSFKPAPLDVAAPYIKARTMMREGRLSLPDHPRLLAQLRAVQWRPNIGGSISIVLPRDKSGHCDLVSAFVLSVWESAGLEVPDEPGAVEDWKQHWSVEAKELDPIERAMLEEQAQQEWEEKFG